MRSQVIVGHDPGFSGALVRTVDGDFDGHLLFPRDGDRLDIQPIREWLDERPKPDLFMSEEVWGLPKDTATTAWQFSRAEATVVTIAQMLGIRTRFVVPSKWTKAILRGFPTATREQRKSSAAAWAVKKYSELEPVLRVKARWGVADAACLAEYGRRLVEHNRV